MSENFSKIDAICILDILAKIGLEYTGTGNTLNLKEHGKETSWWKVNVDWNYINDFNPKKDRAKWWPFAFVKNYLWLSSRETFAWFEENFDIKENNFYFSNKHKNDK